MRKILFFTLLALISTSAMAQQPQKPQFRPDWVYNTPHPGNSTYLYVVEHGEGATKREALNQAIARVFQSTANRIGQFVSTDEINRAVQAGTDYNVIGRNMKVPVHKVCEFPIQNEDYSWTVYVLCQVAKAGNITPEFEECDLCNAHTIFDKNLKYYNESKEIKQRLGELGRIQYKIDGWCYSLGGLAITAGSLMQLGWNPDDDGLPTNKKCAQVGLGLIGGGLIFMLAPSVVKIAIKAKEKKIKNNFVNLLENNNIQKTQQIEDMQLSMGFVPNGVGMTIVF